MRSLFWIISILIFSMVAAVGYVYPLFFLVLVIIAPLFIMGAYDFFQQKHAIRRNFPIAGRFRYILEMIRPEINQYFIESNSDGVPFSREQRSVVYQRAKDEIDTLPFGSQINQYAEGYEWVGHSMISKHVEQDLLRTTVGSKRCTQPYSCNLFNISAMSYGSLSQQAIEALSGGAKLGGFAHCTGEGGVSPYHIAGGGDLIWQVGTGYFGCRADDGTFDPIQFTKVARQEQVKMVEIKISQGAKPGHGGILPAGKVTAEISEIRGVPMGKDVLSPPVHSAFETPKGLIEFVNQLRDLSGGKPVGIKLCIGKRREFIAICKAMLELDSVPDYIAVDGGEGGTGAAPLEFSNHIGGPSLEGLIFVDSVLKGFGLRQQIKVFSAGKVITGFDVVKRLALGADVVYAARSFMLSLGCIQALRCNTNNCPTGVATQNPQLTAGLVVANKRLRVREFHMETVESVAHIMGAMGIDSTAELHPWHILRRVKGSEIRNYGELIDTVEEGAFLKDGDTPPTFKRACRSASADTFSNVFNREESKKC